MEFQAIHDRLKAQGAPGLLGFDEPRPANKKEKDPGRAGRGSSFLPARCSRARESASRRGSSRPARQSWSKSARVSTLYLRRLPGALWAARIAKMGSRPSSLQSGM